MSKDRTNDNATYRVAICTGDRCAPSEHGRALYDSLVRMLGEQATPAHPQWVQCRTIHCMGVCNDGPIVVVHPDGVWYRAVDEAVLAKIVEQHLRQGQPVATHMFMKL